MALNHKYTAVGGKKRRKTEENSFMSLIILVKQNISKRIEVLYTKEVK